MDNLSLSNTIKGENIVQIKEEVDLDNEDGHCSKLPNEVEENVSSVKLDLDSDKIETDKEQVDNPDRKIEFAYVNAEQDLDNDWGETTESGQDPLAQSCKIEIKVEPDIVRYSPTEEIEEDNDSKKNEKLLIMEEYNKDEESQKSIFLEKCHKRPREDIYFQAVDDDPQPSDYNIVKADEKRRKRAEYMRKYRAQKKIYMDGEAAPKQSKNAEYLAKYRKKRANEILQVMSKSDDDQNKIDLIEKIVKQRDLIKKRVQKYRDRQRMKKLLETDGFILHR